MVLGSHCSSYKKMIEYTKLKFPELRHVSFIKAEDSSLDEELLMYEQIHIPKNYKFGIIYVKEGQTEEDQFLSNGEFTSLSRF